MKRYILFSLASSFALFDCGFDTQKAAKDYICGNGEYNDKYVLLDTHYDCTQYVYVSKYYPAYSGKLRCTAWDCAKYFKKVYGVNI